MDPACYLDDSGCVVCPEITPRPSTPATAAPQPVLGWNAGANSIDVLHTLNQRVTWDVVQSVGIVVGLFAPPRPDVANPATIGWGFYTFTSASGATLIAQVVERGALKGSPLPRDADSVFEIRRVHGAVEYRIDDVLVYTSASSSSGSLQVGCALYASNDEIGDITFETLPDSVGIAYTGQVAATAPVARVQMWGGEFSANGGLLFASAPVATVAIGGAARVSGELVAQAPAATVRINAFGPAALYATAPVASVSITTTPALVPTVNVIEAFAPGAEVVISGYQRISGAIEIAAPMARVRILADGPNVIQIEAPVATAAIAELATPEVLFYLEYDEPWMVASVGAHFAALSESLALNSQLEIVRWVWTLRERFGLTASPDSLLHAAAQLEETVALGETMRVVWRLYLSEALALGEAGTATSNFIGRVVDTLILSGVAASRAEARAAIAEVLVLAGAARWGWHDAMTEALALNSAHVDRLAAMTRILERIEIGDTLVPRLTAVTVLRETVALGHDSTSQLDARVAITESLVMMAQLVVNGEVWSAWTINTETKGVARFVNYPFNSFALLPDGTRLGATATGIHPLEGDDDDGEAIQWTLRDGLRDFGERRAKRVPDCFFGYTAEGPIVLKIITSDSESGEHNEHWYQLQPRSAPEPRETRAKIGRGLKSVYWAWELTSVDRASIDVIDWRPIRLDRKLT